MAIVKNLFAFLAVFWFAGCATAPESVVQAPVAVRVGQVWSGHYFCSQGKTDAMLTILNVDTASTASERRVRALFNLRVNQGAVAGSFYLEGTFNTQQNLLHLTPAGWQNRVIDYVQVGLTGRVARSGRRLTGQIDHPRCGAFDLTLR